MNVDRMNEHIFIINQAIHVLRVYLYGIMLHYDAVYYKYLVLVHVLVSPGHGPRLALGLPGARGENRAAALTLTSD